MRHGEDRRHEKRSSLLLGQENILKRKQAPENPEKLCIPLWTRSMDAREQGQVFGLVSPRAVFPPPEGDSDCWDRRHAWKETYSCGYSSGFRARLFTGFPIEASSPRRNATPYPDETKLNTFFYRTTFSTTDFHPPGETPARGNALPSSKARATRRHARTATSRTAPSLPCHSIAAYLLYRTCSVASTTGSEVFRTRLVLPERLPIPCPTPQQASADNSRPGLLRLRTEDFAGENRRSQDETNDAPAENENRPIKTQAASPGEACRFRQGRTRPVHIFTYRTRAARSGRTRHSGYPATECPRYRPRGSRAYSRRCGTTRSAYRFC